MRHQIKTELDSTTYTIRIPKVAENTPNLKFSVAQLIAFV